eukprot:s1684_g3.t1
MTDKVVLLKQLSMLAALSTELVVQFDDLIEKTEDFGLLTRMEVTEEDCHQVERFVRRFQNKAYDLLGTVEGELNAELLGPPARPDFPVDQMWQDAEAAHPGPLVHESTLLQMSEGHRPEDKQAPVAKGDR